MAKHEPSSVRRAQLFQAALDVCAEKGYHATRVEDIVRRAGLSKGSLYHHFRSKQELFLDLFESMIKGFEEQIHLMLEESPTATEAFRRLMRLFTDFVKQNPSILRSMMDFYLLSARNPAFRRSFKTYYEGLVQAGGRIIQQGIENGEFVSSLDPRRVAWVFFTAGDGLVFVHLVMEQMEQGTQALLDLGELILAALTRGQEER